MWNVVYQSGSTELAKIICHTERKLAGQSWSELLDFYLCLLTGSLYNSRKFRSSYLIINMEITIFIFSICIELL